LKLRSDGDAVYCEKLLLLFEDERTGCFSVNFGDPYITGLNATPIIL
jgi:hypothetical protein